MRYGAPIDAEYDFGLKEGDTLKDCTRGFLFNQCCSNVGPHVPDRVTVIKEYPRFILVQADFYGNRGKSYLECINKAAYIAGDVRFKKVEEDD